MKTRRGFTLIELLTVIAIIALLSAIIFPVFARSKAAAARNGDFSDMNSLRSALQLYRVDQGAYPPQLLGYVTLYTSGPNAGNVIPANELKSFLYSKRVGSLDTFVPSWNRNAPTATTQASYPPRDPRPVGTAALTDNNGDGVISGLDDVAGARQAFGPADGNVCIGGGVAPCAVGVADFYRISGYDVSEIRAGGATRTELRYTLFWSQFGLASGSPDDDPRQLGYAEPPESTVITWNTGYREYTGGNPAAGKQDIVLFLGGSARPYDSKLLHERSWRVMP
ncbi:MAG TPA: type II secretion system protein [Fimbriimonadaceae bacterium]|nr:type II secretion system protein [Fimbriimonadaceae bacterium]HRE95078.1 type II secretion system protein [Fimbriimonadaceae bacterium]